MEGYENILKNYPEIKQVVAPADCQWDTASAQSTVESWLSAYDLDAIVCENDGMAVGAGNAAGANSGIVIAGVDGTPDGFEAIQDGPYLRYGFSERRRYGCKRHRGCC